ncbi:MAG: restriction endonuclease [Xanthomonadales bacterium]|nr:restriction endonuclease [Xanthomonadaceae bacterium]MBN8224257.1 restriction endonuclease [Xanthomonadales bacterium]MCA0198270.1 restriction endonuclease [Pseudomonadota bacterium]
MSSWILGLALGLLAAVLSVLFLWLVRRPATENAAGLRALADLRWREFATIVGQAMQQRGLRDAMHGNEPGSDQMVMTDGDSRWLLSCKHGMAYHLGAASVEELASSMDLAGARNGILLTEGRAERDALAAAADRGIEVIDGRRLWQLLKPFMPAETTARIVGAANAQARRHTLIALGGSLALGLVVAVLPLHLDPAGPVEPSAAAVPARDPASTVPASAEPASPAATTYDGRIQDNPDEATEARYQADIARTLTMVPGITRAYWLTRATLVIDRSGTDQLVWPFICGELERYPSLRTVRVQLNPRPGTEEKVRWRQCRTV